MGLKKATLLFDEEIYEKLREKSKVNKVSIGELVREAVASYYGIRSREDKIEALNELKRINLPVGDPQSVEKEIIDGYLKESSLDE